MEYLNRNVNNDKDTIHLIIERRELERKMEREEGRRIERDGEIEVEKMLCFQSLPLGDEVSIIGDI